MTPSKKTESAITPAAFRDSTRAVAWTLGADAVIYVLAMIFGKNQIGLYAVQALATELMVGKAGVVWSDASHGEPTEGAVAKRAAIGAGLATLAAALSFGAIALHGGSIVKGTEGFAPIAIGLLSAGLVAVRDELLLRGCVIRAFRKIVPVPVLLAICGLAGAAVRMGNPDATAVEIAVNGVLAVAFASAWLFDRGAWMAMGAHAAWTWTTQTLGRGAFFDVTPAAGRAFSADVGVLVALSLVAVASAAFSVSRMRDVRIEPREAMNGEAHE